MPFLVYEATGLAHAITVISTLWLLLCCVQHFLDEVDKRQCLFGICGNWSGTQYNISQNHIVYYYVMFNIFFMKLIKGNVFLVYVATGLAHAITYVRNIGPLLLRRV